MHLIQIRVGEENKEALLEALDRLRRTLDFELQVAHVQHKQRETDHGTDSDSKDEILSGSPGRKLQSEATISSVVVESSDAEDNVPTPKEIATKLNRWLNHKGVARVEFAKHINRSKSHFADMLNHPPSSLPKGFAKEAWLKCITSYKTRMPRRFFWRKLLTRQGKSALLQPPQKDQSHRKSGKDQRLSRSGKWSCLTKFSSSVMGGQKRVQFDGSAQQSS